MPNCNPELFDFPSFDRRKIEAGFCGGAVSSDGGIMALRAADRRTGLCKALDAVLEDPRNADLITHRQIDLLRQRIYGLALGYEDLNDHDTLRGDLVWQSAVERGEELASSPTLCRLENRADRTSCQGWWANQFRLLLSSAAYVLMETVRRVGLRGTELARAQVSTIRLKILKIGTVIVRNTRRIRLFFSSAYPLQDLFRALLARLSSA